MTDTFPVSATILVLASDPLMGTILHETLERAGYMVVSVDNVGAAVDRLQRMRPDLLIVRPHVNSMPGHMAARYLRTRCPGLPVLMVGGFIDDDRVRVRDEIGEFHTFPKPFSADELLRAVRDVLHIAHGKGH